MMREFRPDDAVEPRYFRARIDELERLVGLYGMSTDYWLNEACENWLEEIKWRLTLVVNY